jgi:hypothetical protein
MGLRPLSVTMMLEPDEPVCLTVVGMQDRPPADGQ